MHSANITTDQTNLHFQLLYQRRELLYELIKSDIFKIIGQQCWVKSHCKKFSSQNQHKNFDFKLKPLLAK